MVDIRRLEKIIELGKEHGIVEIEIHDGDKDKIKITYARTTTANDERVFVQEAQTVRQAPQHKPEPENIPTQADHSNKHTVKSPMVGTVYLSASPEANHFVTMGQTVKVGDTLCLIEAMKMFNRIEADKAGVVSAILVENGQPAEFEQPLFVID